MATGASSTKRVKQVDYVQLNSLSSVVLYDTAKKAKNSRYFEVERIITRRKIPYVSCFHVSYEFRTSQNMNVMIVFYSLIFFIAHDSLVCRTSNTL